MYFNYFDAVVIVEGEVIVDETGDVVMS